eukprot:412913-Alexandrium_andersonii.AAC.1
MTAAKAAATAAASALFLQGFWKSCAAWQLCLLTSACFHQRASRARRPGGNGRPLQRRRRRARTTMAGTRRRRTPSWSSIRRLRTRWRRSVAAAAAAAARGRAAAPRRTACSRQLPHRRGP